MCDVGLSLKERGWHRRKLGELTEEQSVRVGTKIAPVLSCTKHRGLVRSDEYFKNRQIYSADISKYKLVMENWLAYATNHLVEGSIGIQEEYPLACVSPVYTVLSCKDCADPIFMFLLLKSEPLMATYPIYEQASVERRGAVRYRDFAKIEVDLPPYSEQRRIAEILSTVDEAIEQTEALISKTQQIKAGLMHDLFTRGVTADGRLRPPREEAPHLYKESPLGWIPKEWEVLRVQELTSLVTSGSRGWAAFYSVEGTLFVRSQNIRMGYLDFSDRQHVMPPPGSEGLRTKLCPRDLLVTITGNNVGNVACVPTTWNNEAFVSQHVGLLRFHDPALAELAGNFLVPGSPGNQQLIEAQYGQSKPGLNLNNLRDLYLPIPDFAERESIVKCLDVTNAELEAEITFVAQLKALRRGLMQDLLTGRVPVAPVASPETEDDTINV